MSNNNNNKGKRFLKKSQREMMRRSKDCGWTCGLSKCGQELNDKFIDECQKNIRLLNPLEKPYIFR
jgi:hypothetical protein